MEKLSCSDPGGDETNRQSVDTNNPAPKCLSVIRVVLGAGVDLLGRRRRLGYSRVLRTAYRVGDGDD